MAEHTPAPWFVANDNGASLRTSVWARGGDVRVADCNSAAVSVPGRQADARLIAAAPELLAELQAAHRLLALALGCMTEAGRAKFAQQSEIAGLGTDGASRHHERAAVLAKATGAGHA